MIEIKTEKDPNLYVIQADTGQMNQVLMNLMINACDAMPEGGTLTVKSENVTVNEEYCQFKSEAIPGKHIRLIVKDTGTGIPPENLERIFEPFFSAKEIGKGTGLGLAMVYGIVKGHNGWIDVESTPGKGASFSIYLPMTKVQTIVEDEETAKELHGGYEMVLIVDDEESVRNYGQALLENFGYTAITASDGIKALEIYNQEKEKINLVILDLSMPRKSGRETLNDLLKINPSIKVIVSSGFDKSGPIQELLEMGAKGFVQKPYRMEEMLGVVRKVLNE